MTHYIFDYTDLKALIKEKGFTQKSIAKCLGIAKYTFNKKINNKSFFTQYEITNLANILSISVEYIDKYFFTLKV